MSAELKGAEACIRLMRVEKFRQQEEIARCRNNWASQESGFARLRREIAEWESRTGLDHRDLLEGTAQDPYANGQPRRFKDIDTRATAQEAAKKIQSLRWEHPGGLLTKIEQIVHQAIRRYCA